MEKSRLLELALHTALENYDRAGKELCENQKSRSALEKYEEAWKELQQIDEMMQELQKAG